MTNANMIDMAVIAFYLVAVTVTGCLMSRRTRTAGEFMSAGGSLPGWVVGLSIIGTFVSSISFIANPGKSYSGNWNPFVFSLTLPYAAWIATVFFVPFYRQCGSLSAYEHLEKRFGNWARCYAATFNVLYHIGRIGTILFGVSLAISPLVHIRTELIIVVLGVLVIGYTLMGGIEAVIWTDVVQSIVLIGGMLICLVFLVGNIPGGMTTILESSQSPDVNRFSLGSMKFSLAAESFWGMLIFGLFINVQNFAADQTFVQRYFAARSEAAARRSVWMGAIAYLPISAVLFFLGTALFVFYNTTGVLPEGTSNDSVLPYFIVHELPAGVSGLLIAAILAAAMSTVDSSLNSSATLLLCDIRRFFLPGRGSASTNDSVDLRFLRIMTVVLGVAGIAAAMAMINVKSMLDVWWKISGILSGGTLGLILLARFTSIRGSAATLPATVLGVLMIAVITVADLDNVPEFLRPVRELLSPLMAIVFGTLTVVCASLVLSSVQRFFAANRAE